MNTEEYWAKMEEELERIAQETPPRKPWVHREEDILRKFWGRVSGADLSEMLDRSYSSVANKGKRMGLTG